MKGIMLQGTSSNVGKSILATALCRIFRDEGFTVAPFKAQNMTNNYRILKNGTKVATSQLIQAQAAGVEPSRYMTPILLTIGSGSRSDIVLFGENIGALDGLSDEYLHGKWLETIREALLNMSKTFEVLVLEGAGSPVELNLKDSDVANMKTAKIADVPVLLVADVDRGGVFASIEGTLALMNSEERQRVRGVIINKFKGDPSFFRDAVRIIEERTSLPVLGVIPYIEHDIEDEDSLSTDNQASHLKESHLPSDEQINHLAQNVKEHIDWAKIKQMVTHKNQE